MNTSIINSIDDSLTKDKLFETMPIQNLEVTNAAGVGTVNSKKALYLEIDPLNR